VVERDRGRPARHYPLPRARAWIRRLRVPLFTRLTSLSLLVLVELFAGIHCSAPESSTAGETPSPSKAESTTAPESQQPGAQPAAGLSRTRRGDDEPTTATTPAERRAIVFLGTSLTAGFGLPESEAYPALIQTRIDAAGLGYRVVNAGVSGDTSAGGLRRLDWLLRLPIDVLVVELGANDMLRGQSVEALESNLTAILERTRKARPDVRFVVEGMRAAPNLGRDYARAFDAVYPRLAERFGAALVPFLLEDIVARPMLNQADGIHPTAEGHALIAERVWKTLEPLLEAKGAR
jgi:acyl-CoA thioesterase-1